MGKPSQYGEALGAVLFPTSKPQSIAYVGRKKCVKLSKNNKFRKLFCSLKRAIR
jgi:hypothetical protein